MAHWWWSSREQQLGGEQRYHFVHGVELHHDSRTTLAAHWYQTHDDRRRHQ
jgi:hypothetical protein